MKWITRIAHGVGQMQKDLVAGMLSIFAIIYFEQCLSLDHAVVGAVWLTGQIMNAISTPLIGFLSDRATAKGDTMADPFANSYEQSRLKRCWVECKSRLSLRNRKAWHFYGSVLMTISLPCLFGQPESFAHTSLWVKIIFVAGLLTVLQVGWAAVQIAHLTMINYLTTDETERVLLVSLRYLFASVADISSFIMSYVLLQQNNTNVQSAANQTLPTNETELAANSLNTTAASRTFTVEDMPFFRNISLMLSLYGSLFVIWFQCGVPEPHVPVDEFELDGKGENVSNPARARRPTLEPIPEFIKSLDELHSLCSSMNEIGRSRIQIAEDERIQRENHANEVPAEVEKPLPWYSWFREVRFWVCCLVFTTVRTGVTLSTVYLSPFLIHTLELEKSSIVILPVVIYITSLVTTLMQHRITKLTGRLGNTVIGMIFTMGYCAMMLFYPKGSTSRAMLYSAAVLQGIAVAFNNVVAIVVVSDMIGTAQVKTGAFVHGFASLMDKIFTGVSVQLIQLAVPALSYRDVEVYINGSFVLLGGTLAIIDFLYWKTKPVPDTSPNSSENGVATKVNKRLISTKPNSAIMDYSNKLDEKVAPRMISEQKV